MIINKILNVLLRITDFVLLIPHLILINLTALLAFITFGLIMIPFSLIWIVFYFPMIGLSWIYNRIPFLKIPIAILGLPFAFLGYIYINCITHMGETRQKVLKLFTCISWPFSYDAQLFTEGKLTDEFRSARIADIASKNKMLDLILDRDFDSRIS